MNSRQNAGQLWISKDRYWPPAADAEGPSPNQTGPISHEQFATKSRNKTIDHIDGLIVGPAMWRFSRKAQGENHALLFAGSDVDVAAVCNDDLLDHVKAKPQILGLCHGAFTNWTDSEAFYRIKESSQLGRGDYVTLILYRVRHLVRKAGYRYFDRAFLLAMLDCIRDQI